jgi:hypothetical protein
MALFFIVHLANHRFNDHWFLLVNSSLAQARGNLRENSQVKHSIVFSSHDSLAGIRDNRVNSPPVFLFPP